MSNRLDQEREKELSPKRMQYAIESLRKLGYQVTKNGTVEIQISHQGSTIRIFPYAGWFTGKTVEDGRGIHKLIQQLK